MKLLHNPAFLKMPPQVAGAYDPKFTYRFLLPHYWLTWIGLVFLRLSVFVPRSLCSGLGIVLGDIFYLVKRKRRVIVKTNIAMAFPEWSQAERDNLVRAHFRIFVQTALDIPVLWWARTQYLDRFIKVTGIENYKKYYEQGRQIILLTGHFVALEFGGVITSKYFPQIGLIKPARNKLIDWFVHRGRSRFGAKLFLRSTGLRALVRSIKSGYGFYYLPDEDHGPDKSVFVPFLGAEAATITGAAKLVKLCDAVAMPAYIKRLPHGGYELIIKPPLEDFPSGNEHNDARRLSEQLAEHVRDVPAQYMWTFRRYHSRPENKQTPYERSRNRQQKG